ncbi:MAG: tyrosine-type recombinase/integrase, partial [bacterium]
LTMAGSIEQRGPNSWRIVVSSGLDGNGKRLKITRTCYGIRAEAELMLTGILAELASKEDESSKITLLEWSDIWLREHVDTKLAANTRVMYHQVLLMHILPSLGKIRLNQISPNHINAFLSKLTDGDARQDNRGEKLSSATVDRYLRILSACLEGAVANQLISSNPVRKVKVPQLTSNRQDDISYEQKEMILNALKYEPSRLRVMVLLTLTTGLRRGELAALEWKDVDLQNSVLNVCQTVELTAGSQQSIKPLTNHCRKVLLPEITRTALYAWQIEQLNQQGNTEQKIKFVFTQPSGNWMRADEITKQFRLFLKRNNLPSVSLNSLCETASDMTMREIGTLKEQS